MDRAGDTPHQENVVRGGKGRKAGKYARAVYAARASAQGLATPTVTFCSGYARAVYAASASARGGGAPREYRLSRASGVVAETGDQDEQGEREVRRGGPPRRRVERQRDVRQHVVGEERDDEHEQSMPEDRVS